jgi:hypothetical protein
MRKEFESQSSDLGGNRCFLNKILVLSCAALATPCGYSFDSSPHALFLSTIGAGSELDQSVEGNLHPLLATKTDDGPLTLFTEPERSCDDWRKTWVGRWNLAGTYSHPRARSLILCHKVGVDASQNSLMSNNEDIFTALQFHDDRLKTNNNITVWLSATVAVVVFILITCRKVLRELLCNFGIGETITNSCIELVESLPLKLVVSSGKETRGLVGTLEGGGPNGEGTVILSLWVWGFWGLFNLITYTNWLPNELWKLVGVEFSTRRQVGVSTNLSGKIELGFTVLSLLA